MPMHPVRLHCQISVYSDIPAILRLVGQATQRPKSPINLFASFKELKAEQAQ
jgi:hypothetical protein